MFREYRQSIQNIRFLGREKCYFSVWNFSIAFPLGLKHTFNWKNMRVLKAVKCNEEICIQDLVANKGYTLTYNLRKLCWSPQLGPKSFSPLSQKRGANDQLLAK